jgi:hypothetical protein
MTQRRESLMTVLALLVIIAAIPYALIDTIETGRVYLFSHEFLDELPQRFVGPGWFRFILQPVIAMVLGFRSGLADARAGNPPYLFGLIFAAPAAKRSSCVKSYAAAMAPTSRAKANISRRCATKLFGLVSPSRRM